MKTKEPSSPDEIEVRALFRQILACWNRRNAEEMAALFAEDGNVVGFDGSPLNGRTEIEAEMSRIFAHHQTAVYVGKIREVRFLTAEVAILRAVAGMVPPGQTDINPAVNVIQTLVAAKRDGAWRIALYQNTPAQFHDRPELAQQLTEELRKLL
jgi:uncharacterized protein (TIGR02246 family)